MENPTVLEFVNQLIRGAKDMGRDKVVSVETLTSVDRPAVYVVHCVREAINVHPREYDILIKERD